MSTYTDASLIVTPNAYKAGKLYSLKPTDGTGDLDVVRATTATYVDADGVIQTALANEPRLDYTNGSCPSILVEPQRTNLVFPSATATTQTRTVTAVAHTLSFYGTGSVVISGVATGTLVGTGISNRVTLTFTPTAGSLILTVVGSVTNWQLEAGANATSYIPTVASAVTRNADVISKDNIYTNGLITSNGGTWFLNLSNNIPFIRTSSSSGILINTGTTGTSGNGFTIRNSSGTTQSRLSISKVINNVSSGLFNTTTDSVKIAIKWNGLTADVFVNGTKVISETSFTPTEMENLIIDGTPRSINVESTYLFPQPLTDEQCISLTTL